MRKQRMVVMLMAIDRVVVGAFRGGGSGISGDVVIFFGFRDVAGGGGKRK